MPPSKLGLLPALLAGALVLVAAPMAHAEAPAEWKKLSAAADEDLRANQYTAAAEKWEQALKAKGPPTVYFALGEAYRLGGEPEKAIAAYRNFSNKVPRSPKRAEAQKQIKDLEELLAARARAAEAQKVEPPPPPVAPVVAPAPAPPEPSPVVPPTAAIVATDKPAGDPFWNKSLLKKWWVWAAAGAVVAGVAIGVGVGVTRHGTPTFPDSGPGANASGALVSF